MSGYRIARPVYRTDDGANDDDGPRERRLVGWEPKGETFPTFRACALDFVRAMEPDILAASDEYAMRHYAVYRRNKWMRVIKV